MKIIFVSNYINHHQIPFCNSMAKNPQVEFFFLQTEEMEEERIRMGYPDGEGLAYMKYSYREPEECNRLVLESDVVIWGGVEDETMLRPRLEAGKLTLRYSERLYKTGQWKAISPRGLLKKYKDHTRYRKKPVYLLCAGAYVPSDFHIVRSYPGKMLKWGYFPETRRYDVDNLLQNKKGCGKETEEQPARIEILWVGRFIDWKHPELAVAMAQKLRQSGVHFHLTMIGGGERIEEVRKMIAETKMQEVMTLAGYRSPEEVRRAMEEADIFLMTSDRKEGWGAVLNEAMNSGCAVIANHMIGAAPYLIRQGENGFLYKDGDFTQLYRLLLNCAEDADLRKALGRNAYQTITQIWNAETAAHRLLTVLQELLEGKALEWHWDEGPCSKALVCGEKYSFPDGIASSAFMKR